MSKKIVTPEVELINFTPEAVALLVYTKSSRLKAGATLDDVKAMTDAERGEHLSYMFDTIQTSFEMVDYVFVIKNVSRAFTHQVVRTRTASFQQQTMRAVDVRDHTYLQPTDSVYYTMACDDSLEKYSRMIDAGVSIQDARGVLPTAIHTEIIMKANLRTLSQMASTRLCKRTQGEYQDVFKLLVKAVLAIHPWAEPLLRAHCCKTGFCQFPRYKKCPVQKFTANKDDYLTWIRKAHAASNHVANPVVNGNGMTM